MGFLRKVGRKIKKGVKKLFSSKLGSIVGMVGLYFTMSWAAKSLAKWGNSIFGGAGGSTAKAAELTAKVGAEAGTALEAKAAVDAAAVSTAAADATIASTVSSTGASVETLIANSATNVEKANYFIGAQESAVISGASPTVSTTLTEAVATAANDSAILSQTSSQIATNLTQPIDFAKEGLFETDMFASEAGNLVAKEGVSVAQAATDPARFATLGPDATMGQRLGRFAQDPIGITRGAIQNTAADVGAYVSGPDFIPETIAGAGTAYVSNAFAPEQEEMFRSGDVMGQPFQEQAQAAHMQTVSPQLDAAGLGNVRSFTDLANQTLYGTGTPNYLQGIYQPLPTPTMVG
jgi:hypothetical protein